MSHALALVNTAGYPAVFSICQGGDPATAREVGQVGVPPEGRATIPRWRRYLVSARSMVGDVRLTSNTVELETGQAVVRAQVRIVEPDLHMFEIVLQPATEIGTIVLANTWREPVLFRISSDDGPIDCVSILDGHASGEIRTTGPLWVYATIHGITTEPVAAHRLRTKITAVQTDAGDGFSLEVS